MTPQLGLPLYSVREQLPRDFAGTLERIAAMGYAGVETAFFAETIALPVARRQFDALGLTVCAIHSALPLGDQQAAVLRAADVLGCQRIVWHGWPRDPRYDTLDGVRRLAAAYNEAQQVAVAHGLILGIHNHWWECQPVEGQYPYQVFLAELDPRIIFELDAYWARVAGLDPVAVASELGPRVPLLHLKAGPLARHEPMTALGTGALEIPAILHAAGDNLDWAIVELDECATDIFDAVEQSYHYLTSLGLAIGKA